MPKVSIYTRATTGGSRRRYTKATRGSTGPFFLRYEINGKRVWEGLGTRTYTFALADARSKESSLLREEATPPKPSPAAQKSLEELRSAFLAMKRKEKRKDRTPLDPDTIRSHEQLTADFIHLTKCQYPGDITGEKLNDWMLTLEDGYTGKDGKIHKPAGPRTLYNLYTNIGCFESAWGPDLTTAGNRGAMSSALPPYRSLGHLSAQY